MSTSEKRTISVDSKKHLAMVNRMYGIAMALDALDQQKASDRLPGFGLAKTIIERELADLRGNVMHMNLVEVANAGIDIATVKHVIVSGKYANPTIEITFHDLLSEVEE
ncbi:hypothetical protein ABE527_18330 [Brucella sp. TWI432]